MKAAKERFHIGLWKDKKPKMKWFLEEELGYFQMLFRKSTSTQ